MAGVGIDIPVLREQSLKVPKLKSLESGSGCGHRGAKVTVTGLQLEGQTATAVRMRKAGMLLHKHMHTHS